MLDLEPATATLTGLVEGVRDDQIDWPTPCVNTSVGDLLDHIDGLSIAFTAAATKTPPSEGAGPPPDRSRLGTDWRTRIPARLAGLANAWREETAWLGMTQAGGQELPAAVAGVIALDEVVVHGWDIAAASAQRFRCEAQLLEAVHGFVQPTVAQNPQGTPGLFGPPVPVPDDAQLLDRVLGLTGRDPTLWHPGDSST